MRYAKKFIVEPGDKVRLTKLDPDCSAGSAGKKTAEEGVARNQEKMARLQYLLYAENKRSLLVVLQAMDGGGKDGTIRHVLSEMNPQGCRVTSFRAPTAEELAHDFLWRIHRAMPRRGEIGVFNRSHYEDVLVVRVHDLVPKPVWSQRYEQINAFERQLAANGVHILKFFLHISKSEQLARLKKRVDDPDKQWKISTEDFSERRYWDDYMKAYEEALERCSTEYAPWYVIPANKKWFRDLAVSQIIVDTMEQLDMKFPKPTVDLSKLVIE